jgi:hypothetical protein
VDALSRKEQLVALEEDKFPMPMVNKAHFFIDWKENVKEGLNKDLIDLNIMKHEKERKTMNFWMDSRYLYFGDHIHVLKSSCWLWSLIIFLF